MARRGETRREEARRGEKRREQRTRGENTEIFNDRKYGVNRFLPGILKTSSYDVSLLLMLLSALPDDTNGKRNRRGSANIDDIIQRIFDICCSFSVLKSCSTCIKFVYNYNQSKPIMKISMNALLGGRFRNRFFTSHFKMGSLPSFESVTIERGGLICPP